MGLSAFLQGISLNSVLREQISPSKQKAKFIIRNGPWHNKVARKT